MSERVPVTRASSGSQGLKLGPAAGSGQGTGDSPSRALDRGVTAALHPLCSGLPLLPAPPGTWMPASPCQFYI